MWDHLATGRLAILATAIALLALAPARLAKANGAFPDSGQLLFLPGPGPQMAIGTNFGLILTEDGGATWRWVCETPTTDLGSLYQLGVAGRILSISSVGLVYSDDQACGWSRSGGALDARKARDAFVDQANPTRVLALATDGGLVMTAHRSTDGGTTFADAMLSGEVGEILTGIESAGADPAIVYVASYLESVDRGLRLRRSADGGGTWNLQILPDTFAGVPRIILVDPVDPNRIFLRLTPTLSGDRLVLSTDGGATFRSVVAIEGRLTSFLRRQDGTLLATGEVDGTAVGFRSVDAGDTFTPWPITFHARALGERDGVLYAATSNFTDGTALARSTDDGVSFQALVGYAQIDGIKTCAQVACQEACYASAAISLWPSDVCTPGGRAARDGGAHDSGATDAPTRLSSSPGCGCRAAGRGGTSAPPSPADASWPWAATTGIVAVTWWSRARRTGPKSRLRSRQ